MSAVTFLSSHSWADSNSISEQERFAGACRTLASQARDRGIASIEGKNDWRFLASELRHLGAGRFWGADAATASSATRPEFADPLPVILDFRDRLADVGVELLLVPVPPKAVIYPDKLPETSFEFHDAQASRLDAQLREFYDLLLDKGVSVLDLTDSFLTARASESRRLYCRHDSHWAGPAIEIAARRIADFVRQKDWFRPADGIESEIENRSMAINGDLIRHADEDAPLREQLVLGFVSVLAPDSAALLEADRQSPILLMGDSHTLVFHAGGDMHAEGAGLFEHLVAGLKHTVDLIGVRGSGATPSRLTLFRRNTADPGYVNRKRIVVWCLSAREFTESDWRTVPLSR